MAALPGYATTYDIVEEGNGRDVKKGDTVTVHATGVVKESSYQFWSTHDPGQKPFTYKAGVGGVITGWDQGCLGMKMGEKRQITIPFQEGYGANGFPAWKIPPNATLQFLIEIVEIN